MAKTKSKGIFLVLEGIDGSGKSTQMKLLAGFLQKRGLKVEMIDFPQHGEKASGLVDNYLTGKYGTAEEVGPYRASIFYAGDRYDASLKIRQWLSKGKVVLADRYLASNIGHQGGKIKSPAKRKKYIQWLYDLEYGLFGIPKPDLTIILKSDPKFSLKLAGASTDQEKIAKRKSYLGKEKQDIHEKDKQHLQNALNAYLFAAKMFPRDFKVVECVDKGELLPIEIIQQKIIKIIEKIL